MRTAGDTNRGERRNRRGRRVDRRQGRARTRNLHKTRSLNLEGLEGRSLLSASALLLPSVEVESVAPPSAVEVSCVTLAEANTTAATSELATSELATSELATSELAADDIASTPDSSEALPEASEVGDTNTAPIAADDFYTMQIDQQLGSGVLANDMDAEGDALNVRVTADPLFGQLVMKPNGLFTYKPVQGYSGSDNFSYIVDDGQQDSGQALVNISIGELSTGELPENVAPTAVDDAYSVDEDQVLTIDTDGLLANDADPDGDPMTAILVDGPSNGSVSLSDDGSFQYTPNADFHGEDSFTYVANDGQADSNLATVAIVVEAVNDAPVAADDSYSVSEDTALSIETFAGLLANDTDIDGDTLVVDMIDGPANGTVTVSADGSFQYTPNAGFSGQDSFTYVANDGQADSNLATVAIVIEAVNDAPVAADDSHTVAEDEVLTVDAAGVLANDADADGDALTATLVDPPANGSVRLAEDGSFEYTPNADFHGEDSFTYVANDGQADSNLATVAIVVEAVNDAPVAADDSYSVSEDTALSIETVAGMLANDTDIDGDTLMVDMIDGPANGTVTVSADGSFQYTPNAGFNGQDSFTYVANDGQADSNLATVAIVIEAVNDAPVAADDSHTVAEDEVLTVDAAGVLANDVDADGDALTATLVDPPANGSVRLAEDGSFEYAPNADFHGEDSFTYVANDGQADSNLATVAIVIEAVNDAPVAADDSHTVAEDEVLTVDAAGVLANDADADGDALTATLVDPPANGSVRLAEDGSFEYTPNADFHGEDSFTYVANDGQAESNLATVSIVVEPIDLELSLEVSLAAFSDSIESVWEGSSFWVSAFIHDDRDDPLGVVGGAVDIQFDPATVVPTGNVAYGDGFDHFQQGQPDAAAGVIDETGAITTGIGVGVDTFAPFVAWEFVRTSPFGNEAPSLAASFQLDPAEGSDTILPADFALIGLGSPLAPAQIRLGSTEVNLYDADLNDDRVVDHFDLAMFQMHADSSAGDDAYDPTADLNGDSEIDQEDLELVMAAMYQPVSEALTEPEDSATDELLADASEADDGLLSDAFLSAVDDYFANDLS